ncbi:MAG: MFS transporter [Acidimicrobiales bacterium]
MRTSAFSSAADAFVAVSLAGSLFFNLSIDAARPRIVLYLVVTMAPFAVVAPLIGPFVDRVRGGHRWVIAVACLGRAALCFALAFQLRTLALYPLAFSILVLNKTHQVAKSALIPRLVEERDKLVAANSTHSRVVAVAGAVGGAVAVTVLTLWGASGVLFVGSASYGMALLMALRIPPAPVVHTPPARLAIEAQELRRPSLLLGVSSMALIRGGVGFFAFFAAFTLKAAGEPTWVFGAVAVAGGLGGFAATFIAPALRRLLIEERILEVAMLAPAIAALFVPKAFVTPSLMIVSFTLGTAATLGRQGFDSLVQRDAPDAERGRAFARFEARLQLTWVGGALMPVLVRPSNAVGLYFLGAVLAIGAVFYGTSARAAVRRHWGRWTTVLPSIDRTEEDTGVALPEQLLQTALWLYERGSLRQSVAVCAAALDATRRVDPGDDPALTDAALLVEGILDRVTADPRSLADTDVEAALDATAAVVRADQDLNEAG